MIREHGSLDLQKLLQVMSGILSDRYKVEIVVTASTSPTAWSSGADAGNSSH